MVKEVDYKALAEKNKRIREFGEKKDLIRDVDSTIDYDSLHIRDMLDRVTPEKKKDAYTVGLASFDKWIKYGSNKSMLSARQVFDVLEENLDKEKDMSKEEVEKYQKALAKRGYLLVNNVQKTHNYNSHNEKILDYCEKHLGNHPTGLEKAVTVVSLLLVVLGISIGYPALTGNAIAGVVKSSMGYGAALFFLGFLGVFLANKK